MKDYRAFLILAFLFWGIEACHQDDAVARSPWHTSEDLNGFMLDAAEVHDKDGGREEDVFFKDMGLDSSDLSKAEMGDLDREIGTVWNKISHLDDASSLAHDFVPRGYKVLWSRQLAYTPKTRSAGCLVSGNGLGLWDDTLAVVYYDPETQKNMFTHVDAATGQILWTDSSEGAAGSPKVLADDIWFGPSRFEQPYALKQNTQQMFYPFKGALREAESNNERFPLQARKDGVLFYVQPHPGQGQDEKESYQLIQSSWLGESSVLEPSVFAFQLNEEGLLFVLFPDGRFQARDASNKTMWTHKVGNEFWLTSTILDLGKHVGIVLQSKSFYDVHPVPTPACEIWLFDTENGAVQAKHSMWTSVKEEEGPGGQRLFRGRQCASGTPFGSASTVVAEGHHALWVGNLAAWWPGVTRYHGSIKLERIDLQAPPVQSEAHVALLDQFFGRYTGTIRGMNNGMLGIFNSFDKQRGASPLRYVKLVWASKDVPPVVVHTFENSTPEMDEAQGIHYSFAPCASPPLFDAKGRVFVALHETAWTDIGRRATSSDGYDLRPLPTVLYALEPVK